MTPQHEDLFIQHLEANFGVNDRSLVIGEGSLFRRSPATWSNSLFGHEGNNALWLGWRAGSDTFQVTLEVYNGDYALESSIAHAGVLRALRGFAVRPRLTSAEVVAPDDPA